MCVGPQPLAQRPTTESFDIEGVALGLGGERAREQRSISVHGVCAQCWVLGLAVYFRGRLKTPCNVLLQQSSAAAATTYNTFFSSTPSIVGGSSSETQRDKHEVRCLFEVKTPCNVLLQQRRQLRRR